MAFPGAAHQWLDPWQYAGLKSQFPVPGFPFWNELRPVQPATKDLFQMNRRIKSRNVTGRMSPIVDLEGGPEFLVNFLPADEAGIFGIDNQSVEIKDQCSE